MSLALTEREKAKKKKMMKEKEKEKKKVKGWNGMLKRFDSEWPPNGGRS